jgi:hypothetical protein
MEIEAEGVVKFIPFHRVRRITYQGSLVWEKSDKRQSRPATQPKL